MLISDSSSRGDCGAGVFLTVIEVVVRFVVAVGVLVVTLGAGESVVVAALRNLGSSLDFETEETLTVEEGVEAVFCPVFVGVVAGEPLTKLLDPPVTVEGVRGIAELGVVEEGEELGIGELMGERALSVASLRSNEDKSRPPEEGDAVEEDEEGFARSGEVERE